MVGSRKLKAQFPNQLWAILMYSNVFRYLVFYFLYNLTAFPLIPLYKISKYTDGAVLCHAISNSSDFRKFDENLSHRIVIFPVISTIEFT